MGNFRWQVGDCGCGCCKQCVISYEMPIGEFVDFKDLYFDKYSGFLAVTSLENYPDNPKILNTDVIYETCDTSEWTEYNNNSSGQAFGPESTNTYVLKDNGNWYSDSGVSINETVVLKGENLFVEKACGGFPFYSRSKVRYLSAYCLCTYPSERSVTTAPLLNYADRYNSVVLPLEGWGKQTIEASPPFVFNINSISCTNIERISNYFSYNNETYRDYKANFVIDASLTVRFWDGGLRLKPFQWSSLIDNEYFGCKEFSRQRLENVLDGSMSANVLGVPLSPYGILSGGGFNVLLEPLEFGDFFRHYQPSIKAVSTTTGSTISFPFYSGGSYFASNPPVLYGNTKDYSSKTRGATSIVDDFEDYKLVDNKLYKDGSVTFNCVLTSGFEISLKRDEVGGVYFPTDADVLKAINTEITSEKFNTILNAKDSSPWSIFYCSRLVAQQNLVVGEWNGIDSYDVFNICEDL